MPHRAEVVSGVDPREQTLRTYRNGELVQEANIGEELLWGPDYMIADLARHITLMPGDIVLTGTCHSRSLEIGDTIEVEITETGKDCPAPSQAGRVRGRKQDISPPTAMRSARSAGVTTIECQTVSKTITGEHQDHCIRKRLRKSELLARGQSDSGWQVDLPAPAAPFLCWPEARR